MGYIYAIQKSCSNKPEAQDASKSSNDRQPQKIPILPCDGDPNSNATLNKCGHCYKSPKESKMLINECGKCNNEPCCTESEENECGKCPTVQSGKDLCDPKSVLKVLNTDLIQDLSCNKSLMSLQVECPGSEACFEDQESLNCWLQINDQVKLEAKSVNFLTSKRMQIVLQQVPEGKHHVICASNGQQRKSIKPFLVVNNGLTMIENATAVAKGKNLQVS